MLSRMGEMKKMSERTLDFGTAVVEEFRRCRPVDEAEHILWMELLKTQKSLMTNTAEADGAHSRRDFGLKFQIGLKEARESAQLLRLLIRTTPARRMYLEALFRNCDEIVAILTKSLKTVRRNDERDRGTRRDPSH
jgi:four helix bundle protein